MGNPLPMPDCEILPGRYWKYSYGHRYEGNFGVCCGDSECIASSSAEWNCSGSELHYSYYNSGQPNYTNHRTWTAYAKNSYGQYKCDPPGDLYSYMYYWYFGAYIQSPCEDPDVPFPAKENGWIYTLSVSEHSGDAYQELINFCTEHNGTLESSYNGCYYYYRCKYLIDSGDYCTCHPKELPDADITTLREWNPHYTDATELTIIPGCTGINIDIPTKYEYLTFIPALRMPHMFDVDFPQGSVMISIGDEWFAWRMIDFKIKALEDYNWMDQADKDEVIRTGMITTTLPFIIGMYEVSSNIICEDGTVEYIIFPKNIAISNVYIEISKNAPQMVLKDASIITEMVSNCALPLLYAPACHDCSDEDGKCDPCEACYEFEDTPGVCRSSITITIKNTLFGKTCNMYGEETIYLTYLGTRLYGPNGEDHSLNGFSGPTSVVFDLTKESVSFDVQILDVSGTLKIQLQPGNNNSCGSDEASVTIECKYNEYNERNGECCTYFDDNYEGWLTKYEQCPDFFKDTPFMDTREYNP